ncbi:MULTISPECIES: hypothetical protein [unclassified Shewanella]|jgi:hypothetical protein|nr:MULTISPECIES: hypothetical protein [unclassified Shewanella]
MKPSLLLLSITVLSTTNLTITSAQWPINAGEPTACFSGADSTRYM